MAVQYLVVFAQIHDEFRLPEVWSVAELNGFEVAFLTTDCSRPCMIAELAEEEHARILAQRCILIKSIYQFYARGNTYAELHEENRANEALWARFKHASFKFQLSAHNNTISKSHQRQVIESFDYMGFVGKIDLTNPEVIMFCFEEYESTRGVPEEQRPDGGTLREVFFGRLVVNGSARSLIHTFDVKKRSYFGNTSMEAEISLLMANQTMASPGRLIYDPFLGTGSMAYTAAHFGALFVGSDIDGRQMRGKQRQTGVMSAANQYGVTHRILDMCTFDITQHPWRCGELFDAIVTDPPYGVRAGAKRLGRKNPSRRERLSELPTGPRPKDDRPYIPPTKPYELSDLARDLVLLARYLLKPHGRLVFFLPTTDDYEEIDIANMLCEGMEVVANSLQDFGSWGRRLITLRKTSATQYPPPSLGTGQTGRDLMGEHTPAHKDFREKYFHGFKKPS